MSKRAKSRLAVSDWNEEPYSQIEGGAALARATSAAVYSGDLEGQGTCAWLLIYPPDGAASFVGIQSFEGTLAGRSGSFVLKLEGTFEDDTANLKWAVMPGSASGDLGGLRGDGGYSSAVGAPFAETTLDYEFD